MADGMVTEPRSDGPPTGPKPFVRLAAPRAIEPPDFPPDLAAFYAEHEAVEFEGQTTGRCTSTRSAT